MDTVQVFNELSLSHHEQVLSKIGVDLSATFANTSGVIERVSKVWKLDVGLVRHFVKADRAVGPQLIYHEPSAKRVEVSYCPVVRFISIPTC